jgi:hypothetical protein
MVSFSSNPSGGSIIDEGEEINRFKNLKSQGREE